MSDTQLNDSKDWNNPVWQGQAREDFLATIKRHRLIAWHVNAVCFLAYSILALAMSVLLGPLVYGVWTLLLDLINLVLPTPSIWPDFFFSASSEGAVKLSGIQVLAGLLGIGLALAGGLVLMAWIGYNLAQALRQGQWVHTTLSTRPVDETSLPEQQFKNTLEEMALAAAIPVPSIKVVAGVANASLISHGDLTAGVFVGEDLLKRLDRPQLQGVAAHLIASLAENDLKVGLHISTILGVLAWLARFAVSLMDAQQRPERLTLLRAMFRRDAKSRALLHTYLLEPIVQTKTNAAQSQYKIKFTWREWLLLPLLGPFVIGALAALLINYFVLSPLVAFAWRQRKYMADASAVKLTREPNGLASVLGLLTAENNTLLVSPWASHFCLVQPSNLNPSLFSLFPPLEKRLQALVLLGADASVLSSTRTASGGLSQFFPYLGAIFVAGLIVLFIPLMVQLSLMLSLIFTVIPFSLLHSLLRALA